MTALPAIEALEGLKTEDGWTVGELVQRQAYQTGSCFSVGYIAKHDDGRKGFLKALDFRRAELAADQMRALEDMTRSYRIRSDETWARARDAYLAGETAEEVAFRFDLTLGSLRHRARQEGWRRAGQHDPDHEHRLDDRWGHIGDDEGYAALAERALFQLRRAMAQGRGGAAASWMRVHDRLTARAELEEAREARKTAQAAEAARLLTERAAAQVRAAASARADAADALVQDITRLALGAAAPGNAASRAALDAELARLERASGALNAAAISHVSDGSHAVSEPQGDP